MMATPTFPLHLDSVSVDWLEPNTSIKVQFKAQATYEDLMQLFDTLESLVDRWSTQRPFFMLMDTTTKDSKPTWTPRIRERSLHVVKLAMSRGLMVKGAIVLRDPLIRNIIQMLFTGVQPFTVRYKMKVVTFTDAQPAQDWLLDQQTKMLAG